MSTSQARTVSVLIPTRNAAKWFPRQLEALHAQAAAAATIAEIVIIDSESEDNTRAIAASDPLCRVISVAQVDFDHGGTRDMAARTCHSDYLWFLTQDAIPAAPNCLAKLIKAVQGDNVACACGRQLAPADASRIEQLNRQFNYPAESFIRSAADIPSLQIRTFFLSDTCCLYRRDAYLTCGGFQHELPTNEDMLMAATFLHKGYFTAYCAEARVWHAHRMTLGQWYRRSFDVGAFMEMYGWQLGHAKAQGEGMKYARVILSQLLREGRISSFLHFGLIGMARLLGDRAGHSYKRLPEDSILRKTQNPAFWRRYLGQQDTAYTSDA